MFTKTGPENFRTDVNDTILLITDGEPNSNTMEYTKQYAKELKDKNILIVTTGVGSKSENETFQKVLIELATSQDFFVKAKFDKLDDILETLVARSCVEPGTWKLYRAVSRLERWYSYIHVLPD